MDKEELIEKNRLNKDDIEMILNEDRGYVVKKVYEESHLWVSLVIGIIAGVIGTHIYQYVYTFLANLKVFGE